MKALLATVISLTLTTVVIGNAYYQKKQFYPSIVYLTNSNPSMAVSTQSTLLYLTLLPQRFKSGVEVFGCSSLHGHLYLGSAEYPDMFSR